MAAAEAIKRTAAVLALSLLLLLGIAVSAQAATGQLYAFGYNYYGQLGSTANNGTVDPNPTPSLVTLPASTGPAAFAAAGGNHSLVITATGQLYAFGRDRFGMLGRGATDSSEDPHPTPGLVTLPGQVGPVTQAAGGFTHSLAITATGQLYAFGGNQFGQLGRAANTIPNPTPTLVSLPGATGPVRQISAGTYHSLALTSTGQLYAFGFNYYGELGKDANNGTVDPNPKPSLVSLPGATGPVVQIAAGGAYSLALTSTGQLYAFGENRYGQLGVATNSGTPTPNPTPMLVSLPDQSGAVRAIAAGGAHSLALTSTGQLYGFGENKYGQLGVTTNNYTVEPNPTPQPIVLGGANGPITEIAAGAEHSLVATASGQLYAFGRNQVGQLGLAANTIPNPTPALVPLTVPAGEEIAGLGEGSMAGHALVVLLSPPDGPPPAPLPPTEGPARPRATGPRHAVVKKGKAMLLLACPGPTTCSGRVVLKAKLKKRQKPRRIGAAAFSIAAGKQRKVAVPLKRKALKRLRAAGKAGLRTQLRGTGVKARRLSLSLARRRPASHPSP